MKFFILLILFTLPFKSFALRECTIWKVAVDELYNSSNSVYTANYFKHHDTAKRKKNKKGSEYIKRDPNRKKITRASNFRTCKKIAKRLAKNNLLCGTVFTSSKAYVGAYGPTGSNVSTVPQKRVATNRLHFKVVKNQGNPTVPVEGYVDCP